MSLGWIILLGVVVVILAVGLFSMMTNPAEVDAEEEATVAREEEDRKKKRFRFWKR